MPNRNDLLKRAEEVRHEIADLDQAIARIPPSDAQREERERLRTVRAHRERRLKDLEAQLFTGR